MAMKLLLIACTYALQLAYVLELFFQAEADFVLHLFLNFRQN